jgi:hypothetical protein
MPRLFAAVSFVLTLETARLGVYLHLSPTLHVGGTHVHHMVTGLALLLGGGVLDLLSARPRLRAVLFGVGAALVLDEFALIYHLQDVYYGAPGRLSLEVSAAFGLFLIALAAGDPLVRVLRRVGDRLRS